MSNAQKGYSLKKRRLKDWIYNHGKTQPYMARQLGITKSELQRKLNDHELFNEKQIRTLVHLVKAEAAIEIIYFPTLKEKCRVKELTFGRKREAEELNERNKKIDKS
jgi:transcriptional regulator with XRE-family HTH domain